MIDRQAHSGRSADHLSITQPRRLESDSLLHGSHRTWDLGCLAFLDFSADNPLSGRYVMWIAICITVVASTGNNIGKALQKSATSGLPRLTLDSVVLYRYLSSKEWVSGLAADLGGGLLMIAAVARAPVSGSMTESAVHQLQLLNTSEHFRTRAGVYHSTCVWTRTGPAGSVLPLLLEGVPCRSHCPSLSHVWAVKMCCQLSACCRSGCMQLSGERW